MPVNALLVRWIGGWTERTGGPGAHRREATLGLGAQQSLDEAHRLADGQLAVFADVRTEITVDPKPRGPGELPWIDYRVGDLLIAPEWDGSRADQRILSLGCALDDNGLITFSIDLKDRVLGERERAEQALKKMSDGTLRGNSKVATPTGMVGKRNVIQTGGGCSP